MAGKTDGSESMNYVTRDEFSARIELIETRIDARIESMSAKIDGFLVEQAERDKLRLETEARQETARQERDNSQEQIRLERLQSQEKIRLAQEQVHLERDKRYALVGDRSDSNLHKIEEATRNLKPHYWAATTVHFLAMVAMLVGCFYANQANVLVTMQTTLAMIQSVKEGGAPTLAAPNAILEE
ncbi:hypothetical protein [Pseudomonas sp. TWP3-2]|uniref:hypothetical protein n=1 Tax=Pseudomonas sp. TWP3-2 TaxID=2804574 RepID=UPI003CE6764C